MSLLLISFPLVPSLAPCGVRSASKPFVPPTPTFFSDMHKRAVQHIPDFSSGFRHTFRRHRSGPGRGSNRSSTRFADPPFEPRGKERGKGLVSEELRKVLSPEACGWLEGKSFRREVDGKGKGPARDILLPHRSIPPSHEQQQFAAEQTIPETTTIFEDEELGATADAGRRIPAGSLVELRKCVSSGCFHVSF